MPCQHQTGLRESVSGGMLFQRPLWCWQRPLWAAMEESVQIELIPPIQKAVVMRVAIQGDEGTTRRLDTAEKGTPGNAGFSCAARAWS